MLGIIGLGNMGKNHLRVLYELKIPFVACDSDETKENLAKIYNCKFYTNYKEMLKHEKLDGVIIATPTEMHAEIALECIKEGINVLIEKPITQDIKEAQEIVNLAKEKKLLQWLGMLNSLIH